MWIRILKSVFERMDIYRGFFVRMSATNGELDIRDKCVGAIYFDAFLLDFFEFPNRANDGTCALIW